MDLSLYFEPVDLQALGFEENLSNANMLSGSILMYNPEAPLNIQEAQMAIVGVPESRNSS